jgi:phasin family protein
MSVNLEQFAASNKATVDSLLAVANAALVTAERIAALNLGAARSALEDSASATKAALAIKTPNDAAALQSSLLQPGVEKVASYSRSLYEISTESQQQWAKMLEAQFADFQKQVGNLVDQAAKSAPAGSENIVSVVQGTLATANSAFNNMMAMTKQFADAAQANLAAATKAAAARK